MMQALKLMTFAFVPLGLLAQMNGGLTGFGMMGQAMSGMGASGPVFGPDGTAYVLRTNTGARMTMGTPSAAAGTDLVAINPADGSDRWKLHLSGYILSQPVFAPDGTIFITDSEPGTMFDWTTGMWVARTRGDASQESRLFVIATTPTSVRIAAQTVLDVDMISQPVLAPDGAGGYLVYVNTFDMGQPGSMMGTGGTGVDRYLYAFSPDGTIRFKVKLGQMVGLAQ